MFKRRAKLIDRLRRPFRDCLDGSIREISNASGDARLSRRSHRKVAEADSLDSAFDYESLSRRHKPPRVVYESIEIMGFALACSRPEVMDPI